MPTTLKERSRLKLIRNGSIICWRNHIKVSEILFAVENYFSFLIYILGNKRGGASILI